MSRILAAGLLLQSACIPPSDVTLSEVVDPNPAPYIETTETEEPVPGGAIELGREAVFEACFENHLTPENACPEVIIREKDEKTGEVTKSIGEDPECMNEGEARLETVKSSLIYFAQQYIIENITDYPEFQDEDGNPDEESLGSITYEDIKNGLVPMTGVSERQAPTFGNYEPLKDGSVVRIFSPQIGMYIGDWQTHFADYSNDLDWALYDGGVPGFLCETEVVTDYIHPTKFSKDPEAAIDWSNSEFLIEYYHAYLIVRSQFEEECPESYASCVDSLSINNLYASLGSFYVYGVQYDLEDPGTNFEDPNDSMENMHKEMDTITYAWGSRIWSDTNIRELHFFDVKEQ